MATPRAKSIASIRPVFTVPTGIAMLEPGCRVRATPHRVRAGAASGGPKFVAVRHMRPFLLAVALMFWVSDAFGWENFPEYQSLTEVEQESFEGPSTLYSQYFSDLLAYNTPPSWEYDWLSRNKALEVNFGSLSTTRFMLANRLKIHEAISDRFEVRFTYFDESNLERQSTHHIIELIFLPWKRLGLVFYGEPAFRKPNDDTGLALMLRPNDHHEIRIFNTFVDVTRLKYPDNPDTFLEPDLPYARGIVGRTWSDASFLEYAARYETPTRWRFFNENYDYFYWKWFASFYGRRRLSDIHAAAFRIQFDRKHESRHPTGPVTAPVGNWYTNRLSTSAEWTAHSLTMGLAFAGRIWNTDRGIGFYRDWLPYLRLAVQDTWTFTYILALHQESGDEQIGIRPQFNRAFEHRLNISYGFSLKDKGRIVLLGSADLDRFGSNKTWGGGSGHLQLFF